MNTWAELQKLSPQPKKVIFNFHISLVAFDFRWAYGMSPMPCRSQAEMKEYLLMLVRWSTGYWPVIGKASVTCRKLIESQMWPSNYKNKNNIFLGEVTVFVNQPKYSISFILYNNKLWIVEKLFSKALQVVRSFLEGPMHDCKSITATVRHSYLTMLTFLWISLRGIFLAINHVT